MSVYPLIRSFIGTLSILTKPSLASAAYAKRFLRGKNLSGTHMYCFQACLLNPERIYLCRTQTTLRHILGARVLQDCIENRDAISHEIQEVIGPAAKAWGVKVTHELAVLIFSKCLEQCTNDYPSLLFPTPSCRSNLSSSKIYSFPSSSRIRSLLLRRPNALASQRSSRLKPRVRAHLYPFFSFSFSFSFFLLFRFLPFLHPFPCSSNYIRLNFKNYDTVDSAKLMRKAADILNNPAAMQIRYLETMVNLARTPNTKVIFVPAGSNGSSAPSGPIVQFE